jgi:hypothetical protein
VNLRDQVQTYLEELKSVGIIRPRTDAAALASRTVDDLLS